MSRANNKDVIVDWGKLILHAVRDRTWTKKNLQELIKRRSKVYQKMGYLSVF